MESFKSCVPSLEIWRRQRPIALEFSVLDKLPSELIICVTEFLPRIAAASFSLCCTPVYSLIATEYLKTERDHRDFDSFEFLELLARDLPNHIACYHCKKLHAMKHPKRYTPFSAYYRYPDQSEDQCWLPHLRQGSYIYHGFSFVVAQMAMKRCRQGADYSSLLDLLSNEGRTRYYPGIIDTKTALPRIVDGLLFVRVQMACLRYPLRYPSEDTPFPYTVGVGICPHFGWDWQCQIRHPDLLLLQFSVTNERQEAAYEAGQGLKPCVYCATEFRIDIKTLGELGDVIVFTKWQNLGECKIFQDHQWQSHINKNPRAVTMERVHFPAGSICAAFEGGGTSEFDSLLTSQKWKQLLKKPHYFDG